MAEYISLRAYARHRGVALSAVQKAIDSRRVTAIREAGDRITGIDKELADKQWAENTDAVEAARNGKFSDAPSPAEPSGTQPPPGGGPSPSEKGPAGDAAGDQGNFLTARLKGVELDNRMKQLNELERIEELLPRSVVQREFSEIFAQLKNAVSRIPDRKAQALAGETDPVRINRILSDEIRKVFDDYSRRLAESAVVVDDAVVVEEREAVLS